MPQNSVRQTGAAKQAANDALIAKNAVNNAFYRFKNTVYSTAFSQKAISQTGATQNSAQKTVFRHQTARQAARSVAVAQKATAQQAPDKSVRAGDVAQQAVITN